MNGNPKALRLLFLAVGPRDMSRTETDDEFRDVTVWIERSSKRGVELLRSATSVRLSELQLVLNRNRPDIVHFGGHGSDASGELVFLNDQNQPCTAEVNVLSEILAPYQGVVMTACSSRRQAEAIAACGGWAVGMEGRLDPNAAIVFSRTFYGSLAEVKTPKEAFDEAVRQLKLEKEMASAANVPQFFAAALVADVPGARQRRLNEDTDAETPLPNRGLAPGDRPPVMARLACREEKWQWLQLRALDLALLLIMGICFALPVVCVTKDHSVEEVVLIAIGLMAACTFLLNAQKPRAYMVARLAVLHRRCHQPGEP